MAADSLIVSSQELRNAATEFTNANNNIKTITDEIIGIADELTVVWTGDASTMYCNKLRGLRDGMTNMQTKVNGQAQSLTDMAAIFENVEKTNTDQSNELKIDEFV